MTSVRGFTSVLTVLVLKAIIIWGFPNSSKRAPVMIICFILETLNNKQQPYRHVIVNEDITLTNSTGVDNFLFGDFIIPM